MEFCVSWRNNAYLTNERLMSTNEIAGIGDNSSYQCIFDKEHTFAQCQMSFVSENQWVCNTFALFAS